MRLIEDLTWQAIPTDDATPALKGDHCRVIAHVIRQLCGATRAMTDEQETIGIVGAYLGAAAPIEKSHDLRHRTATLRSRHVALRRDVDGCEPAEPLGQPRYLVNANTGELVDAAFEDQTDVARRYIGSSLARGWLDARHGERRLGSRPARRPLPTPGATDATQGTHARCDTYRCHLPHEPDDSQAVNT